ncbi:Gos1p SCDLUD_001376 [Saccharomycodes ludwigii]|uniref:Gos1p n=1 Tax=Saccharomycodes ludwigii TaxID=36035 RepID=UPI001E829E82|nr:hypothetical protein SCDLUD_001376 [Saccharomycodes ludwigii]KAH3901611.1 hypothetical protein SCDLUD_001376 [Saccharomycodes ludwigii]
MSSFATVRSQIISLESNSQELLTKYSSYAQATSSTKSTSESKLDEQIESNFNDRSKIIENLTRLVDNTSSKLAQLQHHRENLAESQKQFFALRSCIQQERNKLNLLANIKKDILQDQENAQSQNNNTNEDDYINEESRKIEQTHGVVDNLIQQAWETREQFMTQRRVLQNAQTKMFGVLGRIPGVNTLIGKINTRRKKNAIILASLITFCILLLFFTY